MASGRRIRLKSEYTEKWGAKEQVGWGCRITKAWEVFAELSQVFVEVGQEVRQRCGGDEEFEQSLCGQTKSGGCR